MGKNQAGFALSSTRYLKGPMRSPSRSNAGAREFLPIGLGSTAPFKGWSRTAWVMGEDGKWEDLCDVGPTVLERECDAVQHG